MDNAPTYSQDYLDVLVAQAVADERDRLATLIEGLAAANHADHVPWIHEAYPRHGKGEALDDFMGRYHSFREEDVKRQTRTEALYDAAIALRRAAQ